MKKLIFSFALIAITTLGAIAQASFGIQAGANFAMGKSSSDITYPGYALTNDPKVGVFGGFLAEIPFGEKIAFRPEFNFIQKGSKTGGSLLGYGSEEFKITLNYIELPLNVVYKLPVGAGNFFFGLGPALAFGLSGKVKYTDPSNASNNTTSDIKFDGKKDDDITDPNDKDGHLKRFDVGANIIAGYKLLMGVFFRVAYTHGFMDVDPNKDNANPDDRTSYKNRGVSLGIGYMFGSK